MKDAPKLEGIVKFSKKDFFMVEIEGKWYPFSKYTSNKFIRPWRWSRVNCYFNDSNQIYVKRIETRAEEVLYQIKNN